MVTLDSNMNNAFTTIDESNDEKFYEENIGNSLKLRNLVEGDMYTSGRMDNDYRGYITRRKKEKRKRKKPGEETRKISNRKAVNKPASNPYIKLVDGEERLCFSYNTKISETALNAMPKIDLDDNEFCVRYDLENVDITKLNEKFKADNCVYPRANLPYELYAGNRWNYETECNRLAWQFVSLNPVLLYGKKGLIQRAVDSYRKYMKSNKGHRFSKDDTFYGNMEKRKHGPPMVNSIHIQWTARGAVKKCKIQANVETIDYSKIPDDFKTKYSVLNDYYDDQSFGLEVRENTNVDNELAIKLAYLNVENTSFLNATKSIGIHAVVKKMVSTYKARKEELLSSEDDTDAYDTVNDALTKAFDEENEDKSNGLYFDIHS